MDLYNTVSKHLAKVLTESYSTSFSLSSRLFARTIRSDIYSIYGLVRIADEVVDTYRGTDAKEILDGLYDEVVRARKSGYSVNPIVQAFIVTANTYQIDEHLIKPFFDSMSVDLSAKRFSEDEYRRYIYGSAEVVGLMCLKVFVAGDAEQYEELRPGAEALGSAYQKINFLRDIKADYETLGRVYFPDVEFETFSKIDKQTIVADIKRDLDEAEVYLSKLPNNSRRAVRASYYYYRRLFDKLVAASPEDLKTRRYRINDLVKIGLLMRAYLGL